MKYCLLAFLFFFAAAYPAFAVNRPILSLYERNPWLMVVGSDSPTFVLYDDGTVIYWEETERGAGLYKTAHLNPEEVEARFLSKVSGLAHLEESYSLSAWTDQPTQELRIAMSDQSRVIHVYGNLRENDEVRSQAPRALLSFYDFLVGYRSDKAAVWEPTHLEVMIWPYAYAPDESIVWPREWPDIHSESTVQRGDAYSLFLPIELKEPFLELMRSRKEKGAVLINGKKWALSARRPFPHEMHATGN